MRGTPRVLIRADSGQDIGAGHIMRCLLLATAMREAGCEIRFACKDMTGNYGSRVIDAGFQVTFIKADTIQDDMSATARIANGEQSTLCILDHYDLSLDWESGFRGMSGCKLMVLDDIGRPHSCDLLHDQDLTAIAPARYANSTTSCCLLGPQYALLPKSVGELRKQRERDFSKPASLIMFMSGSDVNNETEPALAALASTEWAQAKVDVILGLAHPAKAKIEQLCAQHGHWTVNDFVDDLPRRYLMADLSIGGGGMSLWERLALGLPALVTILAENQRENVELLAKEGAVRIVGDGRRRCRPDDYISACASLDRDDLQQLSRCGMALVDGLGLERTCTAVMAYLERHSHG